jgi:UDP-N-acetylmuramoylalanine--D-glutamate ligase
VRYIDDSIATAPERTVAALRALAEPVVLLLGGREKQLPLDGLTEEAARRTRAVICFGEAGPLFAEQLGRAWAALDDAPAIALVDDLPAAIQAARSAAQSGDAVLLAPAGTSFDAYDNFEARGDHFSQLVSGEGGTDGTR